MKKYDHKKIEGKWQKEWAKKKIYKTSDSSNKPKFYVLDMFPYPSGQGLHVGHPKGYIATDIVSRMKRMQGMNVLHPMGFDAFGLPAENYAIKTKTNPVVSVAKNVARYKKQLEILGFDYDWSREVNTTDPKFYAWTQWIFLKLYEKGLAYESYEPINWCPSCKTGLANEDVEDGKCERCGTPVEKKPMRQWVIRITDYADRLLNDLDAQVLPNGDLLWKNDKGEPGITHMNTDVPGKVRYDKKFQERQCVCVFVEHWDSEKFIVLKWKKVDWTTPITGGVEKGQTVEEAAQAEVREETGFKNLELVKRSNGQYHSIFFHPPKDENRVGHFTSFHFKLKDDARDTIAQDEVAKHDIHWVPKEKVRDMMTAEGSKIGWDLVMEGRLCHEAKNILDWPASIKESQKNWIGRSEGAEIDFPVRAKNVETKSLKVFTTRPDTLFGVTYIVIAPEHEFITELLKHKENLRNHEEVVKYVAHARVMTEIERTDAKKDKTGVKLDGVVAKNPANGEDVPVYVADYVLADYGTGAVMAVPAHDERDFAFAKKYKLPIRRVVEPKFVAKPGHDASIRPELPTVRREAVCIVVRNPKNDTYLCNSWKSFDMKGLFTGGIEKGEDVVDTARREILEETGYKNLKYVRTSPISINTFFYQRVKKQNRHAHFTFVFFDLVDDERAPVSKEESDVHEIVWKKRSELKDFFTVYEGNFIIHILDNDDYVNVDDGMLIDSGQFDGMDSASARKAITDSVGGKWVVKYKLKDWVFSRQRYWGEPFPILHDGSNTIPVSEKDLPVTLPKVKSYEPTGTGESPLAHIDSWVNVKIGKGKNAKILKRETNTMPQWAGSSWYYLRYMDPHNDKKLVDSKKEKYWNQVDFYVGGAEHATRHLIYARFWHKFLYDIGVVSTIEPFKKLQSVGLIMGEDGRKMSKRFGNVVNPDEIVETYGADTMRVYEMFMGPFEQSIAWATAGMIGPRRFIERVWALNEKVSSKAVLNKDTEILLNKTIKKVTEDMEVLHHNTAVSSLMILSNELDRAETIPQKAYETLLKLLAPLAPHVTEELWSLLGNKKSIHVASWPVADETKLQSEIVTIIVQVNGKVRANFQAPLNSDKAFLEKSALACDEVKKWIGDKTPDKVVVVSNKLVSIVVKP